VSKDEFSKGLQTWKIRSKDVRSEDEAFEFIALDPAKNGK
jgi:hypothetical protein